MNTTTLQLTSLQRFNNTKKQLKSYGIELRANVMSCCRSCATAEEARIPSWDNTSVVWHFGGQGNKIVWNNWNYQNQFKEWFNHNNLDEAQKKIVALTFEHNGFIVDWDFTNSKSIGISLL